MYREILFFVEPYIKESDILTLERFGYDCKKNLTNNHLFSFISSSDEEINNLYRLLQELGYKYDLRQDRNVYDFTDIEKWDYVFYRFIQKKGEIIPDAWQLKPDRIIDQCLSSDCYIDRVKVKDCQCENRVEVFKDLNEICLKCESNSIQDFVETSERFSSIRGAYIMSTKMATVFIENGLRPIKDAYYWKVSLIR